MATNPKRSNNKNWIKWCRYLLVIFAVLIAATHLPFVSSGNSGPMKSPTSNTVQTSNMIAKPQSDYGFQILGLWFEIEVIGFTLIAVVYMLGIREIYLASWLFNILNLFLFFLSGFVAIPGITPSAFASHLNFSTYSLGLLLMVIS